MGAKMILCTRCRENAAVYSSIWCRLNLLVISFKASETAVPNANRNPNMLQVLRVNGKGHRAHLSICSHSRIHTAELHHHFYITSYTTTVIAFQVNTGGIYQKVKANFF